MRVVDVGDGTPEVAVVGGIHGDEPCGVRAVEALMADPPAVERPVRLVVANERAIERGVRYVDCDLNRAFPGDDRGEGHERRLAARLAGELSGCTTLSLHSTQSYPEPFAIVDGIDDRTRRLAPRLSVDAVVDAGPFVEGRLFAATSTTVEVECGYQGSDRAVENAHRIVREFLAATGVRPGGVSPSTVPGFRLTRAIEKAPADEYEVFVENFERVDAGERFATVDGRPVHAETPFYPVLMSAYGYERLFGYTADRLSTVDAASASD